MPLEIETIKELDEAYLTNTGTTVQLYIEEFLKENHRLAYTKKEISAAIRGKKILYGKIGFNSINAAIGALVKRGIIKKKGVYYWYDKKDKDE